MWATGISLARERARQNKEFTEGKKALSIEDAVKLVNEEIVGEHKLEIVKSFLGSKTVYDKDKDLVVRCHRENWPRYEPADFSVYENVSKNQAKELSKLGVLRAYFSYHPFSKNFKMISKISKGTTSGAKALERLYELYGE